MDLYGIVPVEKILEGLNYVFKDDRTGEIDYTKLKLSYNYFYRKMPITNFIIGPYEMNYLSNGDKHIYMFSEMHDSSFQCPKNIKKDIYIYDYLDQLFSSTHVFIDFFLETQRYIDKRNFLEITKYSDDESSLLMELDEMFEKCINPLKWKLCYDGLIRAHGIDIRNVEKFYGRKNANIMNTWGYKSEDNGWDNFDIDTLFSYKIFIEKMLLNIDKDIKQVLIDGSGISTEKEINRSYRSIEILDFMVEYIKKYRKPDVLHLQDDAAAMYEILLEGKGAVTKRDLKDLKKLYVSIGENLFDLQSRLMDIYTLARIFKKFKNTTFQPEEPTNIIIYQGGEHSDACKYVLRKMGFKKIEMSRGNVKDGCLDVRKIKQPLFS